MNEYKNRNLNKMNMKTYWTAERRAAQSRRMKAKWREKEKQKPHLFSKGQRADFLRAAKPRFFSKSQRARFRKEYLSGNRPSVNEILAAAEVLIRAAQ